MGGSGGERKKKKKKEKGKKNRKKERRPPGEAWGRVGAGEGAEERGSEGVRPPPRTRASPKSRKIMLMKTNGAHKGSLSPASGGAAEGGGLGLSLLPVGLGVTAE